MYVVCITIIPIFSFSRKGEFVTNTSCRKSDRDHFFWTYSIILGPKWFLQKYEPNIRSYSYRPIICDFGIY